MKRILWVCNIMLPAIARERNLPYSNREGWLTGIFERLTEESRAAAGQKRCAEPEIEEQRTAERKAQGKTEIALGICFPAAHKEVIGKLTVDGVSCYGFEEDLNKPEIYDNRLEERFAEIITDFQPDILHVFGTEFPHALAAVRAFGNPAKTLVGIQGLCYEIARVYMANLPEEIQRKVTFRDYVKKDSLKQQQEKFKKRGENEIQTIRLAGHITGRTRFDREGTARQNPHAIYHSMNETMRNDFYTGEWKQSACERHSIFLGQGDYPLKGFHFMLEAMPVLLKEYSDVRLYVAGNSIIENKTLRDKIKLSGYGSYLRSLIHKYRLQERITILGKLSAKEMKQQFLKSGVFVCPSVLENSPNTIGEAMLLGVPVAASFAGGIPDMIQDGVEGLLFPAGNVQKLAEAVSAFWQEEKDTNGMTFAERISAAARRRAAFAHDADNNYRRLMEIYHDIEG